MTFSVADSEIKVKWSLLNFRFTRNLGGRFRGLFCNGGEMGKITPLVYNSLGFCEKLEIYYASTHSYLVSESFWCHGFLQKITIFLLKQYL